MRGYQQKGENECGMMKQFKFDTICLDENTEQEVFFCG
jgi:hypothetical protein